MGYTGDINAPQSVVAHSRAVNGVSFDPFHNERLASFSEDGIVKLWDIRYFSEPVSFHEFSFYQLLLLSLTT